MSECLRYPEVGYSSHWLLEESSSAIVVHLGWRHMHGGLGESSQSFPDSKGRSKRQIRARSSSSLKLVRAILTSAVEAGL